MIDQSASYIGLIVSLILPWITGAIWMRYLLHGSGNWNWPIILGYGYPIGIFITTLTIRIYDATNAKLDFTTIAIIIGIIASIGITLLWLSDRKSPSNTTTQSDWTALLLWQKILLGVIALLILIRYGTIFLEIIWRPIYPWDAWMNWAPKAKIWFAHNQLTEFISPDAWLHTPPYENAYTLGNRDAWKYPETVPLIQLWTAMGMGFWYHSLINIPWLICSISLGLAFYGQFRLLNHSILLSIISVYLLLNIPYINIHTMLAGYADLWLTTTFGMAAFALYFWQYKQQRIYAYIAILFAMICTQIKVPGLILAALIIFALILSLAKKHTLARQLSIYILAPMFILVFLIGFSFQMPYLGEVTISSERIALPYLGKYNLEYHSVWNSIFTSMQTFGHWNIFWGLSIVIIAFTILFQSRSKIFSIVPFLLPALTLATLFIIFFFTNKYQTAIDQTTLNRALLYTIPPILFISLAELARVFNNIRFKQMSC